MADCLKINHPIGQGICPTLSPLLLPDRYGGGAAKRAKHRHQGRSFLAHYIAGGWSEITGGLISHLKQVQLLYAAIIKFRIQSGYMFDATAHFGYFFIRQNAVRFCHASENK